MTPEEHIALINEKITSRLKDKYMRGRLEHGGDLWNKGNLLEEALDELIDAFTYIITEILRKGDSFAVAEQLRESRDADFVEQFKKTKVYLAGPMTGLPGFNFRAFDKARDELTHQGYDVISPADLERKRTSRSYSEALRDDIAHLVKCEAIYLLRGWQFSVGAKLELAVARTVGMRVMHEDGA
jgi:hypothetical protein